MRLSKRQLKRIIREEYSRLKRQGLITEMMGKGYMINHAMGTEDQSFPAGTSVQQAADQMVSDMKSDYPGAVEELQSMGLSVDQLEMMAMDGMTDVGMAVAEAIEFMDIDGSGNFEFQSCITALHSAIYGRRSMAESRRRRGLINESAQSIVDMIVQDNIVADGPKTQESFYSGLVRSGSLSDFEAQVKYSPSSQPIFRDFLGDCDDHGINPEEALGYIREKYAVPHQMEKNPKTRVKKWYGGSV